MSFPYSTAANRITIIVLVANWLLEGDFKSKWKATRSNFAFLLLVAFYLLHAVALFYTADIDEGTYQLEKKSAYLAFAALICTSRPLTKHEFELVLKAFVLGLVASALVCIAYAFHRNNYFETFTDPYVFFWVYNDLTEVIGMQPNYMALFIGFAIIILLHFIVEYGRQKILLYGLICFFTFFMVLLAGRTPFAATVFIVGVGLIVYFYKTKRLIIGLGIVAAIVIAVSALVYNVTFMRERVFQTFGIEQDPKWISQMGDGEGSLPSVRLMKWQSTWHVIKDNWLLGVSPGDSQHELQEEYKRMNYQFLYEQRFNPHNEFLQIWLGVGIIALSTFLATLWLPLWHAVRQTDYLYVAFIVYFALCCVTESILERQIGIIFYALFNALFLQRQHAYVTKPETGK